MSKHDSPTIRRFVRTAWIMLGFQLVFAVGAIGVAIWAASAVRQAVEQRDLLQARVAELESGGNQAAPAPAPVQEVAPEPEPVNEVAPAPEQPVQNTPIPPVTRTSPPVRQPPIRTTPPVYTPPPVYNPPVYNPPPVYTPPPRIDDKPPEVRDEPPPRRPRRPRINIDIPGLLGGGSRDRPTRTPNNPNTRTPGATLPNPNRNPTRPPATNVPGIRQNAAPPATNVPGRTTVIRRRPRPDPQPPQIR